MPETSNGLLIVTPMHNEAKNIVRLMDDMLKSSIKPDLWVIVDDESHDGSSDAVRLHHGAASLPIHLTARSNNGGLIRGSAFSAWQDGVESGVELVGVPNYVMKLDADVQLPPQYLKEVIDEFIRGGEDLGLVGGVITSMRDREQNLHVPGPVKLYSWRAYQALGSLPRQVGFDVLDEVVIKLAGMGVTVLTESGFTLRRAIGASEGRLHGRRRNGVVCRWTGYSGLYFLGHCFRYLGRAPIAIGSIAIIWGYITAGPGPYPTQAKAGLAREQRHKLRLAIRNPLQWIRSTYAR